nr:ABC transporter ATP-binding protein [Prochlorococcus marinus]
MEIVSLTAIIPFLTVFTDNSIKTNNQFLDGLFKTLGISIMQDNIFVLAIFFIVTVFIAATIRVINSKVNTKYASSIGNYLSCKAYKNALEKPYIEHLSTDSSSVIATNTMHIDRTIVSINFFLQLLTSLIISISIVITLLCIEWSIIIMAIAILGTAYLVQIIYTKNRLIKNSKEFAKSTKDQVKVIQEGLGTIRDLIIHQNSDLYLNKFKYYDSQMREMTANNTFIKTYPRFIIEFLGTLIIIIAALILSGGTENPKSAIADLGIFALGCQRLIPSLQQIYVNWAGIKSNYGSIESVINILKKKNNFIKKNNSSKIYENFLSLELKNISMKYEKGNHYILKNFNVVIKRGQIIGIMGETGCGKSTLIDIMMGLLEPNKGQILFNGKNINSKRNFNTKSNYHSLIAHVPQNIYLSNSSIKENIALGYSPKNIDMKKIIESAKKAKIHKSILKMVDGYDSIIGERGKKLSGGQIQRIAIARALYRNSQILFLDEATSALDLKTEEEINKILDGMKDKLTVIKVAHRINALSNCHVLIDLNKKLISLKK